MKGNGTEIENGKILLAAVRKKEPGQKCYGIRYWEGVALGDVTLEAALNRAGTILETLMNDFRKVVKGEQEASIEGRKWDS